jgi:hypothetical protein
MHCHSGKTTAMIDPRYPMITIGYNTYKNVESEKDSASGEEEAIWNFAFWLQNDLLAIRQN